MRVRGNLVVLICLLGSICGCQQNEMPAFVSAEKVQALPKELQVALAAETVEFAGTYEAPRLISAPGVSTEHLLHGQAVYQQQCVQCHGISGDGNGPAAKEMYPRPRDYRLGIFKFITTPYGAKPVRSDLVKTVRQGVRGTSMPAFNLLPEADVDAVVDYVLALTHRGELEELLVAMADSEETIDKELVREESLPMIRNRWLEAETSVVQPLTGQPRFTAEHVDRGKQAFLTKGCSKCHGEDGRGQTADNIGKDGWGFATRAADLTSGMLHGGQEPIDVYRRIYSGINGTPMPGFGLSLKEEPDTIWDLVAYVKSVSGRRRSGESPPPGTIRPYVPSPSAPDSATATPSTAAAPPAAAAE
jgi:mono/diheme cytochrome c family protein